MATVARKALSPAGPALPPPPPGVRPASPAAVGPSQQRTAKQQLPSTEHMKMSDVLLMLDEKLKPFSFQFRSKLTSDAPASDGTTPFESAASLSTLPFPIRHAEDLKVLGMSAVQEAQFLKTAGQSVAAERQHQSAGVRGPKAAPDFIFLPVLPSPYAISASVAAATPTRDPLVANMQRCFQNLVTGSRFVQASASGLHSMALALTADLERVMWTQYDSNMSDALKISTGTVELADIVQITVGDRYVHALGGPCACLSLFVKGCEAAFAELLSTDLSALQAWITGLALLRDITPYS
jgi:hypothetical protein